MQLDLDPAVVVATAIGLAAALLAERAGRSAVRAKQLTNAAALLEEHYEAVDTFASDPAAPTVLVGALLDFSDAIEHRKAVVAAAEMLRGNEKRPRNAGSRDLHKNLKDLARHRPDLAETYMRAISSGSLGAFLRWPETAKRFDELAVKVTIDPSREAAFASSAVQHTPRLGQPLGVAA